VIWYTVAPLLVLNWCARRLDDHLYPPQPSMFVDQTSVLIQPHTCLLTVFTGVLSTMDLFIVNPLVYSHRATPISSFCTNHHYTLSNTIFTSQSLHFSNIFCYQFFFILSQSHAAFLPNFLHTNKWQYLIIFHCSSAVSIYGIPVL